MSKRLETLDLEENINPNQTIPIDISTIIINKPEEKEKKEFWKKLFKRERLKKNKKIAVIYLRENGIAEEMEVKADVNGFFYIYGKIYHEDKDCFYLLGKDRIPFVMIPEWNVTPIGKKSWEDKDMQTKFKILEDHVMKGIRHAERVRMGEKEQGMQLNAKGMIAMGIIGIVIFAVIMSYF